MLDRTAPASESTRPGAPFRRVLLAVTPSSVSPALRPVLDDLTQRGAEVIVCHVVFRPTGVAGNEEDGHPANAEEVALVQTLRSELLRNLASGARGWPIRVLHGDPGQRLCEYAEFQGCDLMLLQGGGRPSLGHRLKGSVRKFVVTNFDRSVLVVGT